MSCFNNAPHQRQSCFWPRLDHGFCRLVAIGMILLLGLAAGADNNFYVRPPGTTTTDESPFDSWESAATQIQWAVNVAMSNLPATVWVTNGEYVLTNVVVITNGITVRSVGAAGKTIVNGNYPATINPCFELKATASGAVLDGFTITNGCNNQNRYPGGVYIGAGLVRNCTIAGNRATNGYGGGVVVYSGGVLRDCTVAGNYSVSDGVGGGVYVAGGLADNCLITENSGPGNGSGLYLGLGGTAQHCTVTANWATGGKGGGVSINNGTLQYSVISSNSAPSAAGIILANLGGTVRNCLIVSNLAIESGVGKGAGGVYVANIGTIQNCTITANAAAGADGGGLYLYGGGAVVQNTIIYLNTANSSRTNIYDRGGVVGTGSSFSNCCFAPALEYAVSIAQSSNNIIDDPEFAGFDAGNFRLARGSRCINAGVNNTEWMTTDLDGHRRIDMLSGIADVGCYEFVFPATVFQSK